MSLFDVRGEGGECLFHRTIVVVVGFGIYCFRDSAWNMTAGLGQLDLRGQPRLVVRVPIVAWVLQLEELAHPPQGAEKLLAFRHFESHGLEMEPLLRNPPLLQALLEGIGVIAYLDQIVIADVNDQSSKARLRVFQ